MYFNKYECGIYFYKVWKCLACSADSETKIVFEEHLTQKHPFLFVYFDEYECGIYSNELWNCSSKTVFVQEVTLQYGKFQT